MTQGLDRFRFKHFFDGYNASIFEFGELLVWEAIAQIEEQLLAKVGDAVVVEGEVGPHCFIGERSILIEEGARIESTAVIQGPAYIGRGAVVRSGAYIRANSIIFPGALVGHCTEVKNSILLDGASTPHFNYVGDSILGCKVNLGAGTRLSNNKVLKKTPHIEIELEGRMVDTGLRKMGAVLGNRTLTGCNSVLNPGCIVGEDSIIYPLVNVRKGYYAARSLFKGKGVIGKVRIDS